jgi:hypothetical protein
VVPEKKEGRRRRSGDREAKDGGRRWTCGAARDRARGNLIWLSNCSELEKESILASSSGRLRKGG